MIKKIKLGVIIISVFLVGIFVYQNRQVFISPLDFYLNLGFSKYEFLQIASYLVFCFFFMLGFIIALSIALRVYLKAKKTLKESDEKANKLRQELDALHKPFPLEEKSCEEKIA